MAVPTEHTQALAGWGRVPIVQAPVRAGEDLAKITSDAVLSRGLGRAYGDAALPVGGPVAITTYADRILSFDASTGRLRAEAGLSQHELMRQLLPQGWFTPVSPGTQFVTLGGMVASDIHGKNHHVHGTFGNFVRSLLLRVADGRVVRCSPTEEAELFWATFGGMGLTGHILEVEVDLERLASPWIYEESERYGSLEEVFTHLKAASADWPMTVAWVDTSATGAKLGRGILMKGRWATAEEAPSEPPGWRHAIEVPPVFPSGVMNRATVRAMNAVWYAKHGASPRKHYVGPEAFYYQLDMATEWNRGYGANGFTQYQCVVPGPVSIFRELLERFQKMGGCSFVTVFKDCGPEGKGILSFPKEGTSMALDIPMGPNTEKLVHELNAFVMAHEGRVYLAKDAFTTATDFARMYPRREEFMAVRRQWDPAGRIRSVLSDRVGLST